LDKLILVSADAHATPPPSVWPDYLEKKYHHLLAGLHDDNERYLEIMALNDLSPEVLDIVDHGGCLRSGGDQGVWNLKRRLAEMDREGIAAEIVHFGDSRAIPLLHSPVNRKYDADVNQAGVRAYHRWAWDTLGPAQDRLLLIGDAGPGVDMQAMLAEMEWIADHGFIGTFAPGYTRGFDLPPFYDSYFDRFWALCEERGLVVVIHGGYGIEQGTFMTELRAIIERMKAAGRTHLLSELMNHTERLFQSNLLGPRQAMWQMMLGGVFDRHPGLRLFMTEVRGDWLPPTLRQLDTAYQATAKTGVVGAKRAPSEYWGTNCFVGLSFIHRAEVEMREEIGVESILFGRDYPHPEGMWPNTGDWLTHAFQGVPDDELRLMLGENAMRILGLDQARLAPIADRIGPNIADITGRAGDDIDPRLVENFHARSGYLKPAEQIDIPAIHELLGSDLVAMGCK
jgi:predicted TIM-barrel fold metal-dependent hydrolase